MPEPADPTCLPSQTQDMPALALLDNKTVDALLAAKSSLERMTEEKNHCQSERDNLQTKVASMAVSKRLDKDFEQVQLQMLAFKNEAQKHERRAQQAESKKEELVTAVSKAKEKNDRWGENAKTLKADVAKLIQEKNDLVARLEKLEVGGADKGSRKRQRDENEIDTGASPPSM